MNCSFCPKESIYFRRYEGHNYCEKHFMNTIVKKVKKTIGSNKLIEKRDRVAIAHSGGKDSSNLLFLLNDIFKNNPSVKLFVITVNEGIKGYRDKAVKKSESFCRKLGIEQHVFSFKKEFGFSVDDIAKKIKSGYCEDCGLLRRYLLNKKVREIGATKLATGHNLDDECQSVLVNILRGDLLRLARVGPMPHIIKHLKFVPRIKPLILIPENESELFARINNIPFHPKKCPYSVDNPLRGKTRNFLNNLEQTSPGIKFNLYGSTHRMKPFIIKKFKRDKIRSCKKCGEPSSQEICKVCEILGNL